MGAIASSSARTRLAIQPHRGARDRIRLMLEPPHYSSPLVPADSTEPAEQAEMDPCPPDRPTNLRARQLRLELGVDPLGQSVFWDSAKQLNAFVIATGSSGSGKTELLKLYAEAARKASLPVILVDVHGDLRSPRLSDYRIGRDYSLNPLEGPAGAPERTAWITAPIQEAADLGRLQSHALTLAVDKTLEQARVAHRRPTLLALKEAVRQSDGTRASVNGLSAALEELFEPSAFAGRELPIANLLCFGGHLNLTELSSRAQLLVVQALLAQIWAAVLVQGPAPAGRLRALLVLDEAARLKGSRLLERVVRECRKFGLGLIVASQLPDDLGEAVQANAGTAVALRLTGRKAQEQAAQLLDINRAQIAELSRPGDAWVRSGEGTARVQLSQPKGR